MFSSDALGQRRDAYASLLSESVQALMERLEALDSVLRVSLFGSYTQGRRDLFTDLDVLVVMDTRMGLLERLRFLYSTLALPVDMDILCYTSEEFRSLKGHQPLKGIIEREQVLFEKKPI